MAREVNCVQGILYMGTYELGCGVVGIEAGVLGGIMGDITVITLVGGGATREGRGKKLAEEEVKRTNSHSLFMWSTDSSPEV